MTSRPIRCLALPLVALLLVAAAVPAIACSVPVFRYGLERWAPDGYLVILLHRGELSEADAAVRKQLGDAPFDEKLPGNITLIDADLSDTELPASYTTLWESVGSPREPTLVVKFPLTLPQAMPALAATELHPQEIESKATHVTTLPLTEASVQALLDSPARREIARRILDGESAVWVHLATGDKAKDDAAEAALRKRLDFLEKELQLPVIEEKDQGVMSSDGPALRIDFSILRIQPDDPAEAVFVKMLRGVEPELADSDDALMVPVFGRGRALGAVPTKDLDDTLIDEAAIFLTGSCSCEIKHLNPGVDLLISVAWEAFIVGEFVIDHELPPLTGLPSPDALADARSLAALAMSEQAGNKGDTKLDTSDDTGIVPTVAQAGGTSGGGGGGDAAGTKVWVTMILAVVVGIALLAAATGWIMRPRSSE